MCVEKYTLKKNESIGQILRHGRLLKLSIEGNVGEEAIEADLRLQYTRKIKVFLARQSTDQQER